jgi:hypothetical protein
MLRTGDGSVGGICGQTTRARWRTVRSPPAVALPWSVRSLSHRLRALARFSPAETGRRRCFARYIERTQRGVAPPLKPPRPLSGEGAMAIDAASRANLELTQTCPASGRAAFWPRSIGRAQRRARGCCATGCRHRSTAINDIHERQDAVGILSRNRPCARACRTGFGLFPTLSRDDAAGHEPGRPARSGRDPRWSDAARPLHGLGLSRIHCGMDRVRLASSGNCLVA